MQASHLNKIIFSCILYLGIWQNANCQIDTKQISKADSLFKTNQLLEAEKIYLQFYNPRYREIENIKLKLAFIAKEKNDWANEIYYLSSIQAENAKPSISQRLNQISQKHQLGGYEMDFVDQLIWIYFAFFPYIMGFLLSIAMYAAIILIYKKQKNRKSPSAYIYSPIFLPFSTLVSSQKTKCIYVNFHPQPHQWQKYWAKEIELRIGIQRIFGPYVTMKEMWVISKQKTICPSIKDVKSQNLNPI